MPPHLPTLTFILNTDVSLLCTVLMILSFIIIQSLLTAAWNSVVWLYDRLLNIPFDGHLIGGGFQLFTVINNFHKLLYKSFVAAFQYQWNCWVNT